VSALAHFAYMVLFSYSFFFRGLTGITITVGSILTLALLMTFTAKVNWETILARKSGDDGNATVGSRPVPVPPPVG